MPNTAETFDAIVVGAGLAGISAARDLADRGQSVLLLEGGDRIGGRGYSRDFEGLPGVVVDMGGSFVNPAMQPRIREEIQRYGIALKSDKPPGCSAFFTGGELRTSAVPAQEFGDLERAFLQIRDASLRFTPGHHVTDQPVRDLDVSVDEFLRPLELPPATRDFIYAMLDIYVGTDPGSASALSLLAQIAAVGNSPYGLYGALNQRFVGGLNSLLSKMLSNSQVDLRLNRRVLAVEQSASGVRVRSENGEAFNGTVCIIAVPTNVIRHITFSPALSADKMRHLAENHLSRAIKLSIRVRNLPPRPFALGTKPISMIISANEVGDGTEIIYGFTNEDTLPFEPNDVEKVERVVREYFPNAEVLGVDFKDWGSDPLFDGTYRIDRPGTTIDFLSAMNCPEDRVVFAGTDVDQSVWRTWYEGALNSAHVAVGHASHYLV